MPNRHRLSRVVVSTIVTAVIVFGCSREPTRERSRDHTAPAPAPAETSPIAGALTTICPLMPETRCQRARSLANACTAADAPACRELADLFFAPPIQPGFGQAFLANACKAGDAAACARADLMHLWFKGAMSARPACERGDVVACFQGAWGQQVRREPIAVDLAWRACRGGVADGCGLVAAADPAAAREAYTLGCRAGSPLHCDLLDRRGRPR